MIRTARQVIIVALSVALVGSWASAPTFAQGPQGNQGLQGGWAVDNQGNILFPYSLSPQYSLVREAGAGWVRLNFRLGGCFKDWTSVGCNGQTALQTYDVVVDNARGANLKVLGLLSNESWIGGQAQWTALAAETTRGNGDNRYIRNFADKAARVLAGYFAGRVDHWEIWNEPNAFTTPRGWLGKVTGGSYMYPSNFAWLLKQSYDGVKRANRGAVVISGGILSHDIGGTVDTGADYLVATYSQGERYAGWKAGRYPLDGVGQHVYIDQGQRTSAQKLTAVVGGLRDAYLQYEGAATAKRTYLTEIGWATDAVSESIQAENLQIAYQTFRSTSPVSQAYWFLIQDIPGTGIFYGLVDSAGQPKPAFRAYELYAV